MFKDRARKTMTKVKGREITFRADQDLSARLIMLTQLSLPSSASSVYHLQSAQGPITSQLSLPSPVSSGSHHQPAQSTISSQLRVPSPASSVYYLQSAQGPFTSQLSVQYTQQEVDTRQFTPSIWNTL